MANGSQRLMAIIVASAMLIGGFAIGRVIDMPRTNATAENPQAVSALQSTTTAVPATTAPATNPAENQPFYLTDYKTGYSDGYTAGVKGQNTTAIQTDRAGYNEGYKEGYADAIQTKNRPQAAATAGTGGGEVAKTRAAAQPTVVYRSEPQARRKGSTLKTVLTIAAPAAIGAGIGAAAGGGKGAAAGALIGGGGGALYHVIKNRNRE